MSQVDKYRLVQTSLYVLLLAGCGDRASVELPNPNPDAGHSMGTRHEVHDANPELSTSGDGGFATFSDAGLETGQGSSEQSSATSPSTAEPDAASSSDAGSELAVANVVPWALPHAVGSPLGGVSSIGHYDFNGDGRDDLLAGAYGAGKVVWFSGDQQVPEAQVVESNVPYTWFSKASDLDGDGDLDVVVGSYGGQLAWYNNDGDGNFEARNLDDKVVGPWLALADLTGDGRVDIVAGPDGGTEVYLYRGARDGFGARETIVSGVGAVAGLLVRDVDSDELPDLVIGTGLDNEVAWYLNDGSGHWERAGAAPGGAYVGVLGQADVNGDGTKDLLTIEYSDDRLAWYPAIEGGYGERQPVPVELDGVYALTAADFDGDGLEDLAVGTFAGGSSALLWLRNDGGGTWGETALISVNMGQISSLDAYDADSDGDPDLLVGSFSGSQIWRFENRRGESATTVQLPAAGTYVGGQELWTLVHLGFPVEVIGNPELTLQIGERRATATYARREGTSALWFVAQVLESDVDADGVELSSQSIDLARGGIVDVSGEPIDVSVPPVNRSGAKVVGSAPHVVSVKRLQATPTPSATVTFEVLFSEPVTRRSAEDFTVHTSGDLLEVEVTEVTGQDSTAIVAVSTGSGSGVLELEVLPNAELVDAEGNPLAFNFRGGEVYTIDRKASYEITEFYTEGHGDIAAGFSQDAWSVHVQTDQAHDPSEVLIYGGPEGLTERPSSEGFAFLGAAAGEPIYVWPAIGIAGVPELGVGGAGIPGGIFAAYQHPDPRVDAWGEWARMQVVALRSPAHGSLSVYTTDVVGQPVVWVATADGISEQDAVAFAAGSHQHFNFAFTQAGTYELDVVFSAYRDRYGNNLRDNVADNLVESGVVTLYFAVDTSNGPTPHVVRSGVMRACTSQPYALETGELLLTARHMDVLTLEADCSATDAPILRLSSSYNTGVWGEIAEHHEFDRVTLVAGSSTLYPDFPDLGDDQKGLAANAGDEVWLFPEGAPDSFEQPWPGLQSYQIPAGVFQGDQVQLELVAAETPPDGRVQLFHSPQDPYSPIPLHFDTGAALEPFQVATGTHNHFNWLFTRAGLYRLTFRAAGKLLDGRSIQGPEQTLRVWVGDVAQLPQDYPSQMVLLVQPGGGDNASTRLAVSFVGAQLPADVDVNWERQCVNYSEEPSEFTPWHSLGLGDTWDVVPVDVTYQSCEYRARLVDSEGTVLALTQSYVE